VLFVCPGERARLGLAKGAGEALTGRVGVMGSPAEQWYFPAREHLFLAVETHVHSSRPTALALPQLTPKIRDQLDVDSALALTPVALFPATVVAAAPHGA
jgi:hypothetical protein